MLEESEKLQEKIDPNYKEVRIGHQYRDGSATIKQDYQKAAQFYSKVAAKNNAEALFNLALTREGNGVSVDYRLAFTL